MESERLRIIRPGEIARGPVVYWMSRDQRVSNNHSLVYAQSFAIREKVPLAVVFCLADNFLVATLRQYDFMLRGLTETALSLGEKNISFHLLRGNPGTEIPKFVKENKIGMLVGDFDPLKIKREWKNEVAKKISVPFHEIDSHNVVPCRAVSGKQEYGAYTIRPKIQRLLKKFMVLVPKIVRHPVSFDRNPENIEWEKIIAGLKIDRSVPPVEWIKPGEKNARAMLKKFLIHGISRYSAERNDPNADAQSNLSPYIHFGQISAITVALETIKKSPDDENRRAFLEELIVRRELSDNFCWHNENYDNIGGIPGWAKASLREHKSDKREYIYMEREFESASTHDRLWNAAQIEMVKRGKMHGWMRMYWSKKILEWTKSPDEAIRIAIYLNDKYELDGRDPNGYAGILWSIGGLHDRPWGEREIFGKVRYMNYNGARRKFDVERYIERFGA
ncbi:MAG TPA: deoxyribodipyrimidine photo-lyase [Firmicutes bacterium]|nr:deoxyribodipyrimidine photo-lyase [Bacillota bacterium]